MMCADEIIQHDAFNGLLPGVTFPSDFTLVSCYLLGYLPLCLLYGLSQQPGGPWGGPVARGEGWRGPGGPGQIVWPLSPASW